MLEISYLSFNNNNRLIEPKKEKIMKKLKNIAIALLILSAAAVQADPKATHGMVLFGNTDTYASHMPMFHSPHDYQVIMKIGLEEMGHQGTVVEYQLLKLKGDDQFTLLPEKMDLTKVISGEISSFTASLFQGHFEKGGKDLGLVLVKVEKLIFSAKLDPSAPEQSKYLLFGQNGEYFALHLINGKPSFDTILSVKAPYKLEFNFCRTRVCADPKEIPVPDSQLPQTVTMFNDQLGSLGGTIIDILNTIYSEEEELAH